MNEPAGVWKYVRGFENLSLCDWPGRSTCIIFLGGCNLRCPTCHNYQLAWDMHSLPQIDPVRIKSYIRDRAGWLDGITVKHLGKLMPYKEKVLPITAVYAIDVETIKGRIKEG